MVRIISDEQKEWLINLANKYGEEKTLNYVKGDKDLKEILEVARQIGVIKW